MAALGATARVSKAIPAVDAAAVALVALVHLALGQREAHGALQSLLRHRARSVESQPAGRDAEREPVKLAKRGIFQRTTSKQIDR